MRLMLFKECPESTYKDFLGYADECTACPDNSGHTNKGSAAISDCECFTGYRGSPVDGQECTSKYCRFSCDVTMFKNLKLPFLLRF